MSESESTVLRKKELIEKLKKLGVHYTSDGRKLEEVSLYTLEWTNIQALNQAVK
ncbi:hypothetical protein [Oceanobacillus kimchii]|uniref:hypothetical protein n=1 Tax=Oceanobacillus kimchii TaxID=746691 RepID=UPI00034772D0|nr:hypothetical protein [Oceanobacillus kimchii]